MKHTQIILAAIILLTPFYSLAQDVITTTNGTEIRCIVVSITKKSVRYQEWKTADSSKKEIVRQDVFKIVYEDGTKKLFYKASDTISMSFRGKHDARKYYKKYNAARTGTIATTALCGPIIGLAPAIASASTSPKSRKLGCPDTVLMNNVEYRYAYKEEAHKIKKRRVWGGYVTGIVIDAAIIAFVSFSGL